MSDEIARLEAEAEAEAEAANIVSQVLEARHEQAHPRLRARIGRLAAPRQSSAALNESCATLGHPSTVFID